MIVEKALIEAKSLYDKHIADDQTKSIAIVRLAELIIEERGKNRVSYKIGEKNKNE